MTRALFLTLGLLSLLVGCGSQFGEPDEDTASTGDTGLVSDTSDSQATDDTGGDDTGELIDADGDGYSSEDDCDDNDASVYPGAPETPGDGVDSNCDGDDDT